MSDNLLSYLDNQQAKRSGGSNQPRSRARETSFGGSGGSHSSGRFYQPKAVKYVPTAKHKSGGGVLHSIGGFFGGAAHDAAHYSDLAAHDIAAMPAGFAVAGKAVVHDSQKLGAELNKHLDLHQSASDKRALHSGWESGKVGKAAAKATYESVRHPLRDPFQAILTAGAVASLGAGSVARVGAAGDAIAAADDASIAGKLSAGGKALAHKPVMPKRFLKVPKNIITKQGTKEMKSEKLQLMHSHRPLPRAFQTLHDRIVERSLNKSNVEHPSLIYKYGASRVGKATSETMRRSDRVRMTLPFELDKIKKFDKPLTREEGHVALFLRSAQVTPAEASDYWASMVDHPDTEHPALLHHLAEVAFNLHQKGALRLKDGKVIVHRHLFPKLHAADTLIKEAQRTREHIIEGHSLLSPEAMHNRLNLVARTMGIDREGEGYTSLATSRKNITPYPRSGSVPVSGGVKNFITKSKRATGKGIRQGFIPDNTAEGVAASLRDALTYLRKNEHRQMVAKYGSDFRNTRDDVLVANPNAHRLAPIPSSTRQALGQERGTVGTLADEHEVGLANAMQAKLHDMIPHHSEEHQYGSKFQHQQAVGVRAPEGYKWVHKNMLGDLAKSTQPRRAFVKKIDSINSAVTAATVYLKLSHVPQRTLTDATTSAMSGALFSRKTWAMFYKLRNEMTPKELNELAQSTGTHGYSALPHEDTGFAGKMATKGANLYSHHIDSHFRLLNLIHEARREGISDPAGIRRVMKFAKNPLMRSKNAAKYEHILARANRVSMMYDGLTAGERATISRAFWFYPWTKAATRFAGHVAVEHPVAAAVGAGAGVAGRKEQARIFGGLPSFEYGLTSLGGNKTTTPGWLFPFNTAADVAELGARPEQLVGNLNPVYAGALTAVGGPNTYGETGQPHPLSQGLSEVFAPTPEARILHDYLNRKDTERKTRMFPHPWWQDFFQSLLVGPEYPKKVNKKALHFAHKKERGGFQSILVPKK